MKRMEDRLMKKSQADEGYMFLTSLHIACNKQTEKKKPLCSYVPGQTCRIKCNHTCLAMYTQTNQVKLNTNLIQHCAGFISAESLYMFRASSAHHQEYLKLARRPLVTCDL